MEIVTPRDRHFAKLAQRTPSYEKHISDIKEKLHRHSLGDLNLSRRQIDKLTWNLAVLQTRLANAQDGIWRNMLPSNLTNSNPQGSQRPRSR